mmetsp:Transcript_9913/g.22906  ORF Transcript_9913/g.22906 Transcript_9913/m.22906 type:complete len:204 (+) Transcript_9913:298-909(+)
MCQRALANCAHSTWWDPTPCLWTAATAKASHRPGYLMEISSACTRQRLAGYSSFRGVEFGGRVCLRYICALAFRSIGKQCPSRAFPRSISRGCTSWRLTYLGGTTRRERTLPLTILERVLCSGSPLTRCLRPKCKQGCSRRAATTSTIWRLRTTTPCPQQKWCLATLSAASAGRRLRWEAYPTMCSRARTRTRSSFPTFNPRR